MDRITLKNYRCFRERQTARLAPLTLLVGENSTGKTSFMAMVRALQDLAYRSRIPDFKERPYDLGSYDEIANFRGGSAGRAREFSAGFEASFPNEEGINDAVVSFDATFTNSETAPVPIKRRVSSVNAAPWIEYEKLPEGLQNVRFTTQRGSWEWKGKDGSIPEFWNTSESVSPLYFVLVGVERIVSEGRKAGPELNILSGSGLPSEQDFSSLRDISYPFSYLHHRGSLYASAPVRSKPHRTYDPSRPAWDPEGDYIPMYLANIHSKGNKEWLNVKDSLEKFGKRSGLFDEISIKTYGKKGSEPFQVQIRKLGKPSKGPLRNLIDMGYGVSQVLPVVTELMRFDAPSVFLLQQPEVHLHPSAQAALGSLFCDVAGEGNQLIIETHSDYILDRIRLDVRDEKTKLRPEDVSILFFERKNLDVQIHSIRIDEMGNILDAPQSYRQFFMDETKRALNL